MTKSKNQSEAQKQEEQMRLLEERRDSLLEEQQRAETTLSESRALLREGQPDALDGATIAQARFTTLSETLQELGVEIEMLQADLEISRANQRRAEIVRQLVSIANSGCDHWREYERARDDANQALIPPIEQMLRAMNGLGADRRRFVQLAGELAPGITLLTRMRPYDGDENRQAQLDELIAELEACGADLSAVSFEEVTHFRTAIDRSLPVREVEPFGLAISGACQIARKRAEQE